MKLSPGLYRSEKEPDRFFYVNKYKEVFYINEARGLQVPDPQWYEKMFIRTDSDVKISIKLQN